MTIERKHVYLILAAFLIGWWWSSPRSNPSPWAPANDRPVLRWVVKAAKSLLWVAVFVEEPPAEVAECQALRSEVGDDGYVKVDHGRGW